MICQDVHVHAHAWASPWLADWMSHMICQDVHHAWASRAAPQHLLIQDYLLQHNHWWGGRIRSERSNRTHSLFTLTKLYKTIQQQQKKTVFSPPRAQKRSERRGMKSALEIARIHSLLSPFRIPVLNICWTVITFSASFLVTQNAEACRTGK